MMLRGTAYWAKIVGKPGKAYNPGEFEWSLDVAVDKETVKTLKAEGLGSQLKNKGDDRGDFIQFKRKSVKKDGSPGKPFEVVDNQGQPWENTLVGNGSIVNVKYVINEQPAFGNSPAVKKPGVIGIQVWEHVPYEGGTNDEFPTAQKPKGEDWSEE